MQQLAKIHGISLSGIRAHKLSVALLARSDFILAMDREHLQDVASMMPGRSLPPGAALLGRYLDTPGGEPREIMDPYFGDASGFQTVYGQIDQAVRRLADELQERCKRV